jgi:uncharacterized membrane protein
MFDSPAAFSVLSLLGGLDWPTVALMSIVVAVYFLAPRAGYRSTGRWPLLLAFWGLFLKVGFGSLKLFVVVLDTVDSSSFSNREMRTTLSVISMGELAFLMLSLVLLGIGLIVLRRDDRSPPSRRFLDD